MKPTAVAIVMVLVACGAVPGAATRFTITPNDYSMVDNDGVLAIRLDSLLAGRIAAGAQSPVVSLHLPETTTPHLEFVAGNKWILDKVADETDGTSLWSLDLWPRRSRMGSDRAPFSVKATSPAGGLDNRQASAVCETGSSCVVNELLFVTDNLVAEAHEDASACGPAPAVMNARTTCSRGTCQYTCDAGYATASAGLQPIVCNAATGAWETASHESLLLPRCRLLKCAAPSTASLLPYKFTTSPVGEDVEVVVTVPAMVGRSVSEVTLQTAGSDCPATSLSMLPSPALPYAGSKCSLVAVAMLPRSCFVAGDESPSLRLEVVDVVGNTATATATVHATHTRRTGISVATTPDVTTTRVAAVTTPSRGVSPVLVCLYLFTATGVVVAVVKHCAHMSSGAPTVATHTTSVSTPSAASQPGTPKTPFNKLQVATGASPVVARMRRPRMSTPRQCMSPVSNAFRLKV